MDEKSSAPMPPADADEVLHSSHWGTFYVRRQGDGIAVRPHPDDPHPFPHIENVPASLTTRRISKPMVRKRWLERGPGPDQRTGRDAFVELEWDEAVRLVGDELARVKERHSSEAIYGGSYGWASAGRFHHAQSQIHRFLNTALGGYVRSVNNYSAGAAQVILPHVLGPIDATNRHAAIWPELAEHCELVLCFGGMATKNSAVSSGGVSRHKAPGALAAMRERGCEFVLFSPLHDDLALSLRAEWLPVRPLSDVAVMLGIAHTVVSEGLHDRNAIDRTAAGFDRFEAYLLGRDDGQPKDADWAAGLSEIAADQIRAIARKAARSRTVVVTSQSLQRSEHGEQTVWMGLTLATILGQIGLPGGGYYYGLGSTGNVGNAPVDVPLPTLPQGRNAVTTFIPVARVADMLLDPGGSYDFDGRGLTYPDIRLVYWAGGNPFHHHQDLTRLEEAFGRPDTIVVHEPFWTATASRADIVLPCTVTLERDDIGASSNDTKLLAMRRAVPAFGEARDDFAIFADIADRLGSRQQFTEDRTVRDWLVHLYETTQRALAEKGHEAPDFRQFWERGELDLPTSDRPSMMTKLRRDGVPLPTPSGRVELFSETVASFGYDDCPGHAAWLEPVEWLGGEAAREYPLQLVSNQPATRLHSQLDFGSASQATKIDGREPIRINPADAGARGIADGDTVYVYNRRGAFLAGARISDDIRPGVLQIATGAWYDPVDLPGIGRTCIAGNPNAVTRDVGTSRLAQGCSGHLCLVQIRKLPSEIQAS